LRFHSPAAKTSLFKRKPKFDTAVSDYVWLCESDRGMSARKPVVRKRNRVQRIPSAIGQGRRAFQILQQAPRLVPLFPIGSYTPHSRCAHSGPIERGSVFCCMVCHTSGQDDHPALQYSSAVDLNAELEDKGQLAREQCSHQPLVNNTRRQRRQKLFGAHPRFPI
jgi:hypothetical protein